MSANVKSSQLSLFPVPARSERPCGMPPGVFARWELAYSPKVKAELVAVATARPVEWLEWRDFREVMDKYKIGFCMGHVLGHLVREGRLEEKKVYLGKGIGAEQPGSGNYQGYTHNWRAAS